MVKAGDKQGGWKRKRKEEGEFRGEEESDRVTDTKTHRGWKRREEDGIVVEGYSCLVCQTSDV